MRPARFLCWQVAVILWQKTAMWWFEVGNKSSSVSVKQILASSWDAYAATHEVTDYQHKEVQKAINCYGTKNGCFVYFCKNCDNYIFMSMGCNSRICSCCGKRYADQWSHNLSQAMFKVSHRHFVMSVPSALWPFLRDWKMCKVYMDAAIAAFQDYFSKILHRDINVGVIVVFHPFGKDMKFQPHLHILLTEGGYDTKGRFVKCEFVPADGFRKKWQYHVLRAFQANGLPNTLASQMYKQYPKGFYIWLHSRGRINNPKIISRYVGRYVRHPAIANSRIDSFDGKNVKFHYVNNENTQVNVTMTVDQFITALIQHIPPKQFKMIRYYGAYARKSKRKYSTATHSSITQLNLYDFGLKRTKHCPFCHTELEFVWYLKKPPPQTPQSQKELTPWINHNSLKISQRSWLSCGDIFYWQASP